jgi:hypothetical protein
MRVPEKAGPVAVNVDVKRDTGGFLAMGFGEILMHSWDARSGSSRRGENDHHHLASHSGLGERVLSFGTTGCPPSSARSGGLLRADRRR